MNQPGQPAYFDDYVQTEAGFRTRAVGLDFETKKETVLNLSEVAAAQERGQYVWIDVEITDAGAAYSALRKLELLNPQAINEALSGEPETRCSRYADHWHLVLAGCAFRDGDLMQQRLDVILGERYMMTLHRGPIELLDKVMRDYQQDFRLYAQTPSFLIYELWDSLMDSFNEVEHQFENTVRDIQQQLMGGIEASVFARVAHTNNDLMEFRGVLRPAATVLAELCTRKNAFISSATQDVLVNMIATIERTLQDILSAREALADSLNLHMSMVAYRTNQGVNKLTAVNMIFLPLMFLCGLYGMNFEAMPEVKWPGGYIFFWVLAAMMVTGVTILMRRMKLL